jgi:ferrous iron transport protein B
MQLQQSYAGRAGQVIEPLFKPMGVDWRVGVGLISAFAAREVFVSSLAVVFQAANDDEATQQEALISQMHQARNSDGELIFTISTVIGLSIFFMIALQCMTTVAMMQRESNSWKLAIVH